MYIYDDNYQFRTWLGLTTDTWFWFGIHEVN